MKSYEGKLLVASPYMGDSNFNQSVILIVKHNENEAFGLVLNRPTEQRLPAVMSMVSNADCVHDLPLYWGGPVEGPLMALHDLPELAEIPGRDGVAVSVEQETLLKLAERKDVRLRMFDGYSGWGSGQLENEVQSGGWLIADARSGLIFGDAESLWEKTLQSIGSEIMSEAIPSACIPQDPCCN